MNKCFGLSRMNVKESVIIAALIYNVMSWTQICLASFWPFGLSTGFIYQRSKNRNLDFLDFLLGWENQDVWWHWLWRDGRTEHKIKSPRPKALKIWMQTTSQILFLFSTFLPQYIPPFCLYFLLFFLHMLLLLSCSWFSCMWLKTLIFFSPFFCVEPHFSVLSSSGECNLHTRKARRHICRVHMHVFQSDR